MQIERSLYHNSSYAIFFGFFVSGTIFKEFLTGSVFRFCVSICISWIEHGLTEGTGVAVDPATFVIGLH
jgi:hypothetical protein